MRVRISGFSGAIGGQETRIFVYMRKIFGKITRVNVLIVRLFLFKDEGDE